jgi:hypothetical protein
MREMTPPSPYIIHTGHDPAGWAFQPYRQFVVKVSQWFTCCQRVPLTKENLTLNKDVFESNWQRIRSQTPAWWSLINSDDLIKVDKAEVKLDKYVTMLRVKYGYTRDQARKEIDSHLAEYVAGEKKNGITPS